MRIDREVSDEDEAGDFGGVEDELEVAYVGGEDPVGFTVGWDDHGGDSRWVGGGGLTG